MRALPPRWAALAVRAAGGQWAPPVPRRGRSGPGPPPPREWALSVSPRGRLRVRLPCQVSVRPLDPQRCPGSDRVLVAVSGGSPGRERDPVRVEHDEALGQVAIVADGVDSKTAVDIRTPVKFGERGGGARIAGVPPGAGLGWLEGGVGNRHRALAASERPAAFPELRHFLDVGIRGLSVTLLPAVVCAGT